MRSLDGGSEDTSLNDGKGCRIWVEDEESYSMDRACRLQHDFHRHPLMQLDALERLAQSLMPKGECRFVKPGITKTSTFDHEPTSPDGRDIEEVFHRIEEPGSWIALYHVEKDPAYARFIDEAINTVRPLIEREQPKIYGAQGFLFISAPPSVTPFHIDRENNFWLQIRGRKELNVWDHRDRQVVSARDVEDFILYGSLRNVRLRDEHHSRCQAFDCGPGDGVYFPSTSPHASTSATDWVKPGDGVSISIGIVFYTATTRLHAHVHALNQVLRRVGRNPQPPGVSRNIDRLKYPLGRAVVGARRLLRRYEPSPSFSCSL